MPSSSTPEESDAEAKASLHLRMRAQGIRDLGVLRAFELVPRTFFVPPRYHALAARDVPLPIDCGQTLLAPGLLARMIERLEVGRGHRLIEIGSGTGYATAILASLADEVIGVERYQRLAQAAHGRLEALGIANAAVAWGDGLALPPQLEAVDRLIAHGVVEAPERLAAHLAAGGVLVCARAGLGGQIIVRIAKDADGVVSETTVCPCRLQTISVGLSAAL